MKVSFAAVRTAAQRHPQRLSACFGLASATFLVVGILAPRIQLNPDELRSQAFPNAGAGVLGLAAGVCAGGLLAAAFLVRDRLRRSDVSSAPETLLARAYQPFVWLVIVPALLGLVTLTARVANVRGPIAVDQSVDDRLIYRFRHLKGFFLAIIQLGSPTGVVLLSLALGLFCLTARKWRAAVLVTFGPPLAGALTEYVLKPLIDRSKEGGYAFPSGHTTGAVSVAVALAILLLPGGTLRDKSGRTRAVLLALLLVLASAVPLGLVVIQYHYVTDVLGGFAVASISMLVFALLLDRVGTLQAKRRARKSQLTSPMCGP